jgi:hypothetical protein
MKKNQPGCGIAQSDSPWRFPYESALQFKLDGVEWPVCESIQIRNIQFLFSISYA